MGRALPTSLFGGSFIGEVAEELGLRELLVPWRRKEKERFPSKGTACAKP